MYDAGVAFASAGQGVPVGLLRPGAFLEADAVVFHDRALAGVQVGDRLVVFGDGRPEGGLSDGPGGAGLPARRRARPGRRDTGLPSASTSCLRRGPAVGVGLRELEVRVQVAHRLGQAVRDVELHVFEQGLFASQPQLGVAHAGQFAAEADRHLILEAAGRIPGTCRRSALPRRSSPSRGEVDAVAIGVDQVVADAEPAIERARRRAAAAAGCGPGSAPSRAA